MNNIKTLTEILTIVSYADKELAQGMALYKVKSLFDDLTLNGLVESDSVYGELIQIVLDTKRKDEAAVNIIRARSSLQVIIKSLELEQVELDKAEKQQDDLAIDSTCVTVTRNENKNKNKNEREIQLQLNNMPKKIGRPKSANALSGAERAKKARDKKKANKLVTVNSTLSEYTSKLYNDLLVNGYDLETIVSTAHDHLVLKE